MSGDVRNGTRPAIVDKDGMVYTNWTIVDQGIDEGWLEQIGWHHAGDTLIIRYALKDPE